MKVTKNGFSALWGIEREALRIDQSGNLSTMPHPFPPEDPQITVDFAEAQIELITSPHENILNAYYELEDLQRRALEKLPSEMLWPLSLPHENHVTQARPATFGSDPRFYDQVKYREDLLKKHPREKQIISGIHINYSFGADNPNHDYFGLIRNFLRYKPILTYLFGNSPPLFATPYHDQTRFAACKPFTSSVRQSELGYANPKNLAVSMDFRFESLSEYVSKLNSAIADPSNQIDDSREFYFPLRVKLKPDGNISHIEFRIFDLDPFAPLGISLKALRFFDLFLIGLQSLDSPLMSDGELSRLLELDNKVSLCSLNSHNLIRHKVGDLFKRIEPELLAVTELGTQEHQLALSWAQDVLKGKKKRPSQIQITQTLKIDPLLWGIRRGLLFKNWGELELSTRVLIEAAFERGFDVELLDQKDNIIRIISDSASQIVKQATRTSADSYIAPLISENKSLTKKLLLEKGISVPEGKSYQSSSDAILDWDRYLGKKIVIKPNSANFGDRVTILDSEKSQEEYAHALNLAFECGGDVIVEQFVEGEEFRFLVINGKCVAVLKREPANVIGDGQSNIETLVSLKNKDPRRGIHYTRPLEKLRLGDHELSHLKSQGLDTNSVPKLGQKIFLRLNSNISTGGDSIDFTTIMPKRFKDLAVQGTLSLDLKICGLDMIISNWSDPDSNYQVLELNYNPALHIHAYPAIGESQKVGDAVIDLLFSN